MAFRDIFDKTVGLRKDQTDIHRANLIRIPVCGPEEAKKNFEKGRKSYADSPNFPCDTYGGFWSVFRVRAARIPCDSRICTVKQE